MNRQNECRRISSDRMLSALDNYLFMKFRKKNIAVQNSLALPNVSVAWSRIHTTH